MSTSTTTGRPGRSSPRPDGTALVDRAALVDRILDLGPALARCLSTRLPAALRAELGSVTVHQLEALTHLARGPRTMTELARELGVTESAATALADRLVRQDLARRQADTADRRVVLLALSERAARALGLFQEAKRAATAEQLAVLSDAQLASLADLLEALASQGTGQAASAHPAPAPAQVEP